MRLLFHFSFFTVYFLLVIVYFPSLSTKILHWCDNEADFKVIFITEVIDVTYKEQEKQKSTNNL